jgi:hypothetical protein
VQWATIKGTGKWTAKETASTSYASRTLITKPAKNSESKNFYITPD